MRLIKMFGLAAIAAAAVMAFVGVTSASAVTELEGVVLCKSKEDPCAVNNDFPSGTVLHGELKAGTKAVLLEQGQTPIECELSTILGRTNSLLAHGEITEMTFTMCKRGPTPCTVTVENLTYLARGELRPSHAIEAEKYELLVSEKAPNGKPQVHAECGFFFDCKFFTEGSLLFSALDETAGDTALDILQELNGVGGCWFLHPVWHAEYLTRCLNSLSELKPCWLKME